MFRVMILPFILFFSISILSVSPVSAVDNGDVPVNTVDSARRLIEDLMATHGEEYPRGPEFLARLKRIEAALEGSPENEPATSNLRRLIREAALSNPLLDFDRILVIRRDGEANRRLNSHTSDTIDRMGWNNEISVLSDFRGPLQGKPVRAETLHKPDDGSVLKHMNLHFSAEKLLFSGVGRNGNWAILELDLISKELRELTPSDQPDVQWFDGIYLPEEDSIITGSTAGMQGLPCENGGRPMTNLYKVNSRTKEARQLTFEQDSDWHPSMMANGQVLYLRWEYTDTPHYFSRYLFHMNPDGTGQMAFWGSGSYFPTAYTWPRPIPGHPSMVVGCVSGHHAKSETGRLMIINRSLARKYPLRHHPKEKIWGPEGSTINIHPEVLPAEQTGCVQEIPGWGRDVVGNVYDNQGGNQTYTFQNPWPLSDKYFLVSMQNCPGAKEPKHWSLALVDVFDNMTLLYEGKEYSDLFEPIPLTAVPTPPVLVDRTMEGQPATIFCTNIYDGPGLAGVPVGTVKKLRIFGYHYGYIGSGGHESVGLESGWDIKRILGTVPVEPDGSFSFTAPANTPIALQPLDENGAALAIMRSWMTAMPGERLSCNGCHEEQNEATPSMMVQAARRAPSPIEPWHGPARPFGFAAEVQPVLDRYCVGCHNEQAKKEKGSISFEVGHPNQWKKDHSYLNLRAYVRAWGPESDLAMYDPMEWHASTSPLIRMLRKGHHGVELDEEAWDRLYTWIDLNAPHRGMWENPEYEKRRLDLAKLYAGVSYNPEHEYRKALRELPEEIMPILPPEQPEVEPDGLSVRGFPFEREESPIATMRVPLSSDVEMTFVRIPVGKFVMGNQQGKPDEQPRAVVSIDRPFWLGQTEVTNRQYRTFDPRHDTRYLDEDGKDHSTPGYIANHPDQPVARVSWKEAMQFCRWFSEKAGRHATLPTEAQWEWAARGGTATPYFYGTLEDDFSAFANLADAGRQRTFVKWDGGSKIHVRRNYPDDWRYPLRDDRFADKWFVVDYVKQYAPNPFGLYDMIGNVNEWTHSSYRPYPYDAADGRNDGNPEVKKVARGGSWFDRPVDAGSTVRFAYQPYQKVFNVGFRVMMIEDH